VRSTKKLIDAFRSYQIQEEEGSCIKSRGWMKGGGRITGEKRKS